MRSIRLGAITIVAYATIATGAAQERRPVAAAIPVATDGPIAPASVRRSVETASGKIAYRATWFETLLLDDKGIAAATISATSYVREGVGDPARRPVLVLFNGGPGASSSPLHFGAFGPRRLGERDAAGNRALLDNRETLLDVADLVFVDPVGTGFSRPLREGGGDAYWRVDGDARAVLTLVREWLAAHGRVNSPLFIAGESYGGYRLGTMTRELAGLNVAGLILISPALDFGRPADQGAIDMLPTMAVAAWHHRKPIGDTRGVEAVWEAARAFAQSDYAVALQQGSLLGRADRERIAGEMSRLIGLPIADILAADLRVDSQKFLETLVPGNIVGRLDVRVVQPAPVKSANAGRPAAANDPSLGLGRSNVILSQPIGDYLKRDLGVATKRDYYSLTLDVNFSWNWDRKGLPPGASWNVVEPIAALMTERPNVRLLAIGGFYDLATPLLAWRYDLTHGGVPMDRVAIAAFPAGHSPFEGDANRSSVSDKVRQFLKSDIAEQPGSISWRLRGGLFLIGRNFSITCADERRTFNDRPADHRTGAARQLAVHR